MKPEVMVMYIPWYLSYAMGVFTLIASILYSSVTYFFGGVFLIACSYVFYYIMDNVYRKGLPSDLYV